MQTPPRPDSLEAIQTWLLSQVAIHTKLDPAEIELTAPFARYGLDSLSSVTLVADLEAWLGASLPATLFWDYPTIESLAEYLALEITHV